MVFLLALLVAIAQLALAASALVVVARRLGSDIGARALQPVVRSVRHDAVRLAWLVALVATAGSLWMSEVEHYIPCTLCWVQRGLMYPLVLVLGWGVVRGGTWPLHLARVMSVVGAAVSAYHVQLERFPEHEVIACTTSVPCTTVWFTELGYITIPVMALTAFLTIATLTTIGVRHGQGIPREVDEALDDD